MKIVVKGPTYYSQTDEDAFFKWLGSIRCVKNVSGELRGLHITLRRPSDLQLRELLALFFRYKMNMKPLAQFRTPGNEHWFFRNKIAFWHSRVFR